jgi:hypothetical protein
VVVWPRRAGATSAGGSRVGPRRRAPARPASATRASGRERRGHSGQPPDQAEQAEAGQRAGVRVAVGRAAARAPAIAPVPRAAQGSGAGPARSRRSAQNGRARVRCRPCRRRWRPSPAQHTGVGRPRRMAVAAGPGGSPAGGATREGGRWPAGPGRPGPPRRARPWPGRRWPRPRPRPAGPAMAAVLKLLAQRVGSGQQPLGHQHRDHAGAAAGTAARSPGRGGQQGRATRGAAGGGQMRALAASSTWLLASDRRRLVGPARPRGPAVTTAGGLSPPTPPRLSRLWSGPAPAAPPPPGTSLASRAARWRLAGRRVPG